MGGGWGGGETSKLHDSDAKVFVSLFCCFVVLSFCQVDSTLELFDELREQHQAVAVKTRTLHDACDRLVRGGCAC